MFFGCPQLSVLVVDFWVLVARGWCSGPLCVGATLRESQWLWNGHTNGFLVIWMFGVCWSLMEFVGVFGDGGGWWLVVDCGKCTFDCHITVCSVHSVSTLCVIRDYRRMGGGGRGRPRSWYVPLYLCFVWWL